MCHMFGCSNWRNKDAVSKTIQAVSRFDNELVEELLAAEDNHHDLEWRFGDVIDYLMRAHEISGRKNLSLVEKIKARNMKNLGERMFYEIAAQYMESREYVLKLEKRLNFLTHLIFNLSQLSVLLNKDDTDPKLIDHAIGVIFNMDIPLWPEFYDFASDL